MQNRSRGIFINESKILLIHNVHEGKEIYVAPGGGVEKDESFEEACIREWKEEINVSITIEKELFDFKGERGLSKYFLIQKYTGKINYYFPSKEILFQNKVLNVPELVWVSFEDIKKINFFQKGLKDKLIKILSDFK